MRDEFSVCETTDIESLKRLGPEWDRLWQRCPNATPFQRPEWLLPWVEVFQPPEIWALEVRRDRQLVGLAPLFINHWTSQPVISTLGAYTSDYLDWLIEPACAGQILQSILEYLEADALAAAGLELSNVPQRSHLLRPEFLSRWGVEVTPDEACPVLRLPTTIEDLKSIAQNRQFRNFEKARRRAERIGQVQVEVATRQTLDELLEGLMKLHQARWTKLRMPGLLASDRAQEFHYRAARALLDQGVLRLWGLRLSGVLIGAMYTLAERNVVYCYLQGFDPDYAEFSPGVQMIGAVVEDAVREGKQAVDFLRGREAYKYAWGAQDEPSFRLRAQGQVPLGSLAALDRDAA
jgi:CelD/BcsL family acetyltransferase involved in cellulose biosynthesis